MAKRITDQLQRAIANYLADQELSASAFAERQHWAKSTVTNWLNGKTKSIGTAHWEFMRPRVALWLSIEDRGFAAEPMSEAALRSVRLPPNGIMQDLLAAEAPAAYGATQGTLPAILQDMASVWPWLDKDTQRTILGVVELARPAIEKGKVDRATGRHANGA